MDSIRTLLHRIATEHDFALLETLRDASVWNQWPLEARHALALLFAEYAATALTGPRLEETFTLAESLAPDCPLLANRRATMLTSSAASIENLENAHLAFKQAYKLDPAGSLIAWEPWADTLRRLAVVHQESHYAYEALTYYTKARQTTAAPEKLGRIYYHMALCHHLVGQLSEEAAELTAALELIELARTVQFNTFCIELLHAETLATLSRLLKRPDLSYTALQHALAASNTPEMQKLSQQALHCHHLIATLATSFYKQNHDTALFSLAYEHFDAALRLIPNAQELHLDCAQFLLFSGKTCQEVAVLQEALTHFTKSGINTQEDSPALADWAEAEILLGSFTEDLRHLRSAEKKTNVCIKARATDSSSTLLSTPSATPLPTPSARAISLHALLLTELGRYFSDPNYYQNALNLLKEAPLEYSEDPNIYLSGANAYFGLGEITRDAALLEKACLFYSQVVEHNGEETLHLYNDWASASLRLGELKEEPAAIEKAVQLFETALAIGEKTSLSGVTPTEAFLDCLYSYGCALDGLGDYSQEINHYEKAVHVLSSVLITSPEHLHARYNLALSLSHLGEVTQDIEPLKKAIELFTLLTQDDPEDESSWQEWGISLIHLAEALQDPGRPEESRDLLHDAESKLLQAASLGNPRAYYYLACAHSLLENPALSIHYLQRAAQEKCLPTAQQLVEEDWLANLRTDPSFLLLLEQLPTDN